MDLIECERCGREWDGFAQCNCFYNYSSDDDNESFMKDVGTQTKRNRWGPTKLEIAQKAVDNLIKIKCN
jgi:hypothetical protein